jgi:hypothetical protein
MLYSSYFEDVYTVEQIDRQHPTPSIIFVGIFIDKTFWTFNKQIQQLAVLWLLCSACCVHFLHAFLYFSHDT